MSSLSGEKQVYPLHCIALNWIKEKCILCISWPCIENKEKSVFFALYGRAVNKRRKVGEYNISVSSPWKKREGNSTRGSQKVAKYTWEKEKEESGGREQHIKKRVPEHRKKKGQEKGG